MAGRAGLLGQIQKGTQLKKVETNDRSSPLTPSSSGSSGGGGGGGGSGGGGGGGGLFGPGGPMLPSQRAAMQRNAPGRAAPGRAPPLPGRPGLGNAAGGPPGRAPLPPGKTHVAAPMPGGSGAPPLPPAPHRASKGAPPPPPGPGGAGAPRRNPPPPPPKRGASLDKAIPPVPPKTPTGAAASTGDDAPERFQAGRWMFRSDLPSVPKFQGLAAKGKESRASKRASTKPSDGSATPTKRGPRRQRATSDAPAPPRRAPPPPPPRGGRSNSVPGGASAPPPLPPKGGRSAPPAPGAPGASDSPDLVYLYHLIKKYEMQMATAQEKMDFETCIKLRDPLKTLTSLRDRFDDATSEDQRQAVLADVSEFKKSHATAAV